MSRLVQIFESDTKIVLSGKTLYTDTLPSSVMFLGVKEVLESIGMGNILARPKSAAAVKSIRESLDHSRLLGLRSHVSARALTLNLEGSALATYKMFRSAS